MRAKALVLVCFLLSFSGTRVIGTEGAHEEANSAVGPERGVTELDAEKGFRLSPEARKNFGIAVGNVAAGKGGLEIPTSALLEAQNGTFVYRETMGYFKRIPVEIRTKSARAISIRSKLLSAEDQIVTAGVPFLRAAELDVTSGGEGHGH